MKKKLTSWIMVVTIITSLMSGFTAQAAVSFPDLKGHWSEPFIISLAKQGVVNGFPDGTVRPNAIISRAEYVTLVARIMGFHSYNATGASSFADTNKSWAKSYIEALVSVGVIEPSYYGGLFRPAEPISRMEMARIIVNAIGRGTQAKADKNVTLFTDDRIIWQADKGYVNAAKKYGVINGYPDGRFDPFKNSSRAEAFTIVSRIGQAKDAVAKEDREMLNSGGNNNSNISNNGNGGFHSNGNDNSASGSGSSTSSTGNTTSQPQTPPSPPAVSTPQPPTTSPNNDSKPSEGATNKPVPSPAPTPVPTPTPAPAAQISINCPKVGYTDIAVSIGVNVQFTKSFTWQIDKLNGNGDFVSSVWKSGELYANTVNEYHFTDEGLYRLTANALNNDGKGYSSAADINIITPANLTMSLPDFAHTDTDVEVKALGHNLSLDWSIKRDSGAFTALKDMDNSGGKISLREAEVYTIKVIGTDKYGRRYETADMVKVYPVTEIDFTLPSIAHTDTDIKLDTTLTNADGLVVAWSLTRDGASIELSEHINGKLTENGGSIRFIDKGEYVLTASITNVTGRVFKTSQSIKVYPIPTIKFSLPDATHTDRTHEVVTALKEMDGLSLVWSLNHNGKSVELDTHLSGALSDNGGTIQFRDKGDYTLAAHAIDQTGRKFAFSTETVVYPVASLDFDATSIQYVNTSVLINTSFTEANYPINWTITKADDGIEITDTILGSLSRDGGDIKFANKGNYRLTASMTDPAGRTFTTSKNVKIIVELNCDFDVVSRTHIKPDIAVSMKKIIDAYDGVTQWTLVKSGSAASYTGGLNNGGGSFRVSNTGSYTLTATVTDALGKTSTCSRNVDVYNNPPAKPKINLPDDTSDWGAYHTGTIVRITAESTDPDGDTVSYVWENRERENNDYPYGWHTVKCKAVDQFGAESAWESATFLSAITTDWNKITISDTTTAAFSSNISPYAKRVTYVVGLNNEDRRPNDKVIIYAHNRSTGKYDNIKEFAPGDNTSMQGSVDPAKYDKLEAQIYPYDGGLKGKEMQFNVFIKYK